MSVWKAGGLVYYEERVFGEGRGGRTVLMAVSRVGLGPVCLAPKRRFMMGKQWWSGGF